MSGHLELYRTTVNLRGLGSGTEIEIDPTDEAWGGDIRARRIVPVVVRVPASAWQGGRVWVNGVEVHGTVESFAEGVVPHPGVQIRRPGLEQLADPIEYELATGAVSETYLTDDDEAVD